VISRRNVTFFAILLFIAKVNVYADIPSLKQAYANDFLIGTCIATPIHQAYLPRELDLIAQQFDVATPENCMKPAEIHPSENKFTFEQADELVQFCLDHQIVIHGHTLVWHNQTPNWFFVDGDHPASRDLLLMRLYDHIQTVVGRYKGKVRSWDVVNEAIADNGPELLRNSKWHQILGDEFIADAFRFAHEADPSAELQYNDYSIESGPKFRKALKLLKGLKEQGVPIDSVGIQGHWIMNQIPFADIENAIVEFHRLGLKVNITELDMDVLGRAYRGADINGGGPGVVGTARPLTTRPVTTRPSTRPAPNLPVLFAKEADQYAKLFTIFHNHRDAIEYVVIWGADDGHSWLNFFGGRRANYGVLFDRALEPKPNFFSIIHVVPPTTTQPDFN
jgi:endo-1,4-beta-xylanase